MRFDLRPLKFIGMGLAAGIALVIVGRCGPPNSNGQSAGGPPADTDSSRLARGTVMVSTTAKVVDGPFVLTDTTAYLNALGLYLGTASCPDPGTTSTSFPNLVALVHSNDGIYGARIFIPAGRTLGVSGAGTLAWSGFHPY